MVFTVLVKINFVYRSLGKFHEEKMFRVVLKKKPQASFSLNKLAINLTESKVGSLVITCPMNEMDWRREYQVKKVVPLFTATILHILSFAVRIVMNVLLIMASNENKT